MGGFQQLLWKSTGLGAQIDNMGQRDATVEFNAYLLMLRNTFNTRR